MVVLSMMKYMNILFDPDDRLMERKTDSLCTGFLSLELVTHVFLSLFPDPHIYLAYAPPDHKEKR